MISAHTLSWPWPALATFGSHPARAMLDQLSGLPVMGWEASCRLSKRGIETGRLLAGLMRDELSATRWSKLLDEMVVPQSYRETIVQYLPSTNRVYIAWEQGAHSVTRKFYLESDRGFEQAHKERLTILGYKWNINDTSTNDGLRITEYWSIDDSDPQASVSLLREKSFAELSSITADHHAFALVVAVMISALKEAQSTVGYQSPWQHRHMNVRETGRSRASMAFNFYDSGLRVESLRDVVSALAAEWSLVSVDVERLFDAIGQRELAWLAGGLSTEGLPFLTIYCAATRDDASQACFAADPTLWGGA